MIFCPRFQSLCPCRRHHHHRHPHTNSWPPHKCSVNAYITESGFYGYALPLATTTVHDFYHTAPLVPDDDESFSEGRSCCRVLSVHMPQQQLGWTVPYSLGVGRSVGRSMTEAEKRSLRKLSVLPVHCRLIVCLLNLSARPPENINN